MTHGEKDHLPAQGDDFGFIPLPRGGGGRCGHHPARLGQPVNRKNAKTKYTLERVGVEAFKAEVENRAGVQFADHRPV